MIKRATKVLRQLAEKSRKKGGGEAEQGGTDPAGMTFDEALTHLQQSQAHLDTLSQPFILSLRDSQQVLPHLQTKTRHNLNLKWMFLMDPFRVQLQLVS